MTFLSGGVAELSHPSVLTQRLWSDLDAHFDALEVLQTGLRDATKADIMRKLRFGDVLPANSVPAPASTRCPMNTLMVAYGVLLTNRWEASGSPPSHLH